MYHLSDLVDVAEVDGGLLLALSSGEEDDAGDGGGHGAAEGGHGGAGDLGRGGLLRAALTRHHHVGLEKGALQEDVVIVQGLEEEKQN